MDSTNKKPKFWNIAMHLTIVMCISFASFVIIFCVLLRFMSGVPFLFSVDWLERALNKISNEGKSITDIMQVSIPTLGIITGAGAAVLAYRKQVIDEMQHVITERKQAIDEKQHVTDRFIKAVELLNSQEGAIVTGAAYTLEGLAHDSPIDRVKVVEVLCSYFRNKKQYREPEPKDKIVVITEEPIEEKAKNGEDKRQKYLDTHLEAVLFVLARLNKTYEDVRLNLSRIDIRTIKLNFDNSTMSLRNAKLDESHLERVSLRA